MVTFNHTQYIDQRGWSNRDIFKLIKLYFKYKKQLNTPTAAIWSRIAEELHKHKIYKSPAKCRDKWRTLINRYKIVLKGGNKTKFIFFNKIDNVIKSLQASNDDSNKNVISEDSSDEYLDEDTDASVSKSKKRFWAWAKPKINDSNESRQFWSNPEIQIFLKILYKHKDSRKLCKNSYQWWSLLSEELNQLRIKKSPRQCWRKWKNLIFTYRRIEGQINNNPNVILRFPFYEDMKKIVDNENQAIEENITENDGINVIDVTGKKKNL